MKMFVFGSSCYCCQLGCSSYSFNVLAIGSSGDLVLVVDVDR